MEPSVKEPFPEQSLRGSIYLGLAVVEERGEVGCDLKMVRRLVDVKLEVSCDQPAQLEI